MDTTDLRLWWLVDRFRIGGVFPPGTVPDGVWIPPLLRSLIGIVPSKLTVRNLWGTEVLPGPVIRNLLSG